MLHFDINSLKHLNQYGVNVMLNLHFALSES